MVTLKAWNTKGESKVFTGSQYNQVLWSQLDKWGAVRALDGLNMIFIKLFGEWIAL